MPIIPGEKSQNSALSRLVIQPAYQRTLEEKRQESNHKDTDETALNPGKDGVEVVASLLATDKLSRRRVLANRQIRVQRSDENHW